MTQQRSNEVYGLPKGQCRDCGHHGAIKKNGTMYPHGRCPARGPRGGLPSAVSTKRVPSARPAEERFWEKVEKTETCWIWQGSRSSGGYGNFYYGERLEPAHRRAYEWLVGPVPGDKQLDHLCRVRACVNPSHLEIVDNRTNTIRGMQSRGLDDACRNGHSRHGNTVVRPDGSRYCGKCQQIRQRASWPSRTAARREYRRGRAAVLSGLSLQEEQE